MFFPTKQNIALLIEQKISQNLQKKIDEQQEIINSLSKSNELLSQKLLLSEKKTDEITATLIDLIDDALKVERNYELDFDNKTIKTIMPNSTIISHLKEA